LVTEVIPEWIKLISTQSNAVCDESSKKTISPEHVTEALKVRLLESIAAQIWVVLERADRGQQLGFEDFVTDVEESNKEFKQSQKVRRISYRISTYECCGWHQPGSLTRLRRERGRSPRPTV
jgi:hypothetical protein